MAFNTAIEGNGNIAYVDSTNQLKVALSNTPAQVGSIRNFSENDSGSITGTVYLKSPETSSDYRIRSGIDALLDSEIFNYTAQNTSKFNYNPTTQTITWNPAGGMTLNGSGITTASTGATFKTYDFFPLYGDSPTYFVCTQAYLQAATANAEMYIGLFENPSATAAPTEGVYFKHTATGIQGAINYNGSEYTTGIFSFTPSIGRYYKYTITVSINLVEFWIDDILYSTLDRSNASFYANGSIIASQTSRVAFQHRILGSAASAVWQSKIYSYQLSSENFLQNKNCSEIAAKQGLSSIQGPSGYSQGQTASYTNNLAPASATLSNTAAGYTTLGGQWQFAAVAGAETDYALFGYTNTTGSTSISGRTLFITGINISSYNMGAAVATTPTTLQWAVATGGFGSISLANTESSLTRAPRKFTVGSHYFPVGAAIGQSASSDINVTFPSPLKVESGTYFHIILKMPVATATPSQIIRGVASVNGYWE